jgi:hypothetical protein
MAYAARGSGDCNEAQSTEVGGRLVDQAISEHGVIITSHNMVVETYNTKLVRIFPADRACVFTHKSALREQDKGKRFVFLFCFPTELCEFRG